MTAPHQDVLDHVAGLSGVCVARLRSATLSRFDHGLPLRLDGLDPRRRHSYRNVVAQGWFPRFGSQACPDCLSQEGLWSIYWRLPIVPVCLEHQGFLVTLCKGCGSSFRSHRYSPLRPILGPEQPCGNPVGLRNPCRHSVLAHRPERAGGQALECAGSVRRALNGIAVPVFGEEDDARTYLAELRNLATLLLHLASRPTATTAVTWAEELQQEADCRTLKQRGPRWGYSPPRSAKLRGTVLGCAHQILSQPNLRAGGEHLRQWLSLLRDESNGPSTWLINRTRRTPLMERLIAAATSNRRDVGRRLDVRRQVRRLQTSAIPQLIDLGVFHELFADMLGGYESTGRLYVSISVARAVAQVANWSDAAARIGLPPATGARTARAARTRMLTTPEEFASAVDRALRVLPPDRDFRAREDRVRVLASDPNAWFPSWCASTTPARRTDTLRYAITWMWCEVAQGYLDTSPAWAAAPSHGVKASYRAFRLRLPREAQDSLRQLVLPNPTR